MILHFASGKLDFGKEKEQESIYKFAMENILAEAFTEKSEWKCDLLGREYGDLSWNSVGIFGKGDEGESGTGQKDI